VMMSVWRGGKRGEELIGSKGSIIIPRAELPDHVGSGLWRVYRMVLYVCMQ
jgi:hypothetical protein